MAFCDASLRSCSSLVGTLSLYSESSMPICIRALVRVFTVFLFLVTSTGYACAQNYTWSVTGGGTWVDGTNWANNLPGNYPRNANDTAIFSSTGNSSAKTITLDTAL